jgi:hypothetical protein
MLCKQVTWMYMLCKQATWDVYVMQTSHMGCICYANKSLGMCMLCKQVTWDVYVM